MTTDSVMVVKLSVVKKSPTPKTNSCSPPSPLVIGEVGAICFSDAPQKANTCSPPVSKSEHLFALSLIVIARPDPIEERDRGVGSLYCVREAGGSFLKKDRGKIIHRAVENLWKTCGKSRLACVRAGVRVGACTRIACARVRGRARVGTRNFEQSLEKVELF